MLNNLSKEKTERIRNMVVVNDGVNSMGITNKQGKSPKESCNRRNTYTQNQNEATNVSWRHSRA